jgi:hypothetical protein
MRGTMFGHDVHRPELESAAATSDAPVLTTPFPIEGPSRHADTPHHPAAQTAAGGGAPRIPPFADFLRREAARPRPLAAFHLPNVDDTDSIAVSRRRVTSNVLLAVFGVAAVVTAVMLGLRSGTPESGPPEPTTIGTTGATPAGTAAQEPALPSSTGPANVPPPVAPLLPTSAEVAAPRAPTPAPAAELRRAPTSRTAAAETPAVREGRQSRSGRERTSRRTEEAQASTASEQSDRAERTERAKPADTKKEDPDSTLPPSEE